MEELENVDRSVEANTVSVLIVIPGHYPIDPSTATFVASVTCRANIDIVSIPTCMFIHFTFIVTKLSRDAILEYDHIFTALAKMAEPISHLCFTHSVVTCFVAVYVCEVFAGTRMCSNSFRSRFLSGLRMGWAKTSPVHLGPTRPGS